MKTAELEELRTQARNTFWKTGKEGLSRLMEHAPNLWNGRDQRFYRAEKEMIVEHVSPFYWGLAVTGVVFLTLRVTGSRWFTQMRKQYLLRNNGSTSAPSASPPPLAENKRWISYLDQQKEQKKELFRESLALPNDLLISFICGCSSVAILLDTKKLQKDFCEAPLLPGKSIIHTYMCPDMVEAYSNQLDPKAFQQTDDDAVLITFSTFVQNCKIRSAFIEQQELRGEERFDVVPYPGLKGVSR